MATLVFKTEKSIKEDDFTDFFDKEKWGDKVYPFVDHFDPSSLAKLARLSYWKENDRIESDVFKETGIAPDDQALLDDMPEPAKKGWIEFATKLASVSDSDIEAAIGDMVKKLPESQPREPAVWRVYFKMKRDYIKAVVDAGIVGVEVFV